MVGLYAIGDERGGIQCAGFVVFLNAVAIALHRMIKRSGGDLIIPIVENQAFGNLNDLKRIVGPEPLRRSVVSTNSRIPTGP